jgi:hypothetical protein
LTDRSTMNEPLSVRTAELRNRPNDKGRKVKMTDNFQSALLSDFSLTLAMASDEARLAAKSVPRRDGPGCGGMPGLMPNDVFLGPDGIYDPVRPVDESKEFLSQLATRLDRVLVVPDEGIGAALLQFFLERKTNMNTKFLNDNFPLLRDWPKRDLRLLIRMVRDCCAAGRVPVIANTNTLGYGNSALECRTDKFDYYLTYSPLPQDRPPAPLPDC